MSLNKKIDLPFGVCHVWLIQPSKVSLTILDCMIESEKKRMYKYLKREDQQRAMTSYGGLRLILSQYLQKHPQEIEIDRTCDHCGKPHGKPRLAEPSNIHFSVSHSGDQVVFAVMRDYEVGVDVEQIKTNVSILDLAQHTCTKEEVQALKKMDDHFQREAFYVMWTRKEALVKAVGLGLQIPFSSFQVTGMYEAPKLLNSEEFSFPSNMTWFDLDISTDMKGCLVILGACKRVEMIDRRMADALVNEPLLD